MDELVGKDLAGWHVERWYELRLPTDERGGSESGGYFTDCDLARVTGRGKGWHGSDGTVLHVSVMTQNGKSGFVILDGSVDLSDQDALATAAIEKARAKLTPEERKLLGLDR